MNKRFGLGLLLAGVFASYAQAQDLREEKQAWLRLPATQQAALRQSAAAFRTLPGSEQAALRAKFARLSVDEQHGWRLGPVLGRWYPALQPLLGYLPEHEREVLLPVLHSMSNAELEVLARLAFSTPPEGRAALRAALLRQPAQRRLSWLMAQLDGEATSEARVLSPVNPVR